MQFNIQDFRSSGLIEGGARPSLFDVTFPFVGTLNVLNPPLTTAANSKERITFQCTAASLPAFRVDAIPVFYFGRPIYFQGERTFEPWVITILNDEDWDLRNFFEAWSNKMNSLVGNIAESSDPNNYKADQVLVKQYSKDGSLIRGYNFFGMWPSIVGDITLRWDQGNQIETFDCRMVYDFFEPAQGSSGTDSQQSAPIIYDPGTIVSTTGSLTSSVDTSNIQTIT